MKTKLEIKQRLSVLKSLKQEMKSRYMPDRIELASINAEMTTLLWVMQEGSTKQDVLEYGEVKEAYWINDADTREVVLWCSIVIMLVVWLILIYTLLS